MPDAPTRDACLKLVLEALADTVEDHDVAALFDQASAAVDALIDAAVLFPAERYDEECHDCERPIRAHLVDGRCPTVVLSDTRIVPKLTANQDVEWRLERLDVSGRLPRCWADNCDRAAVWDITHYGCASPHCGTPAHPRHAAAHEHYCNGHALERAGRQLPQTANGAVSAQAELGWRWPVQQAIWQDLIAPGDNEWTTWTDACLITEKVAEALAAGGYQVSEPSDG